MNTCPQCEKEFTRLNGHIFGKYCTSACKEKARRKRYKEQLGSITQQQPIFETQHPTPTPTIKPEATPMKKAEVTIPNSLGENATFIIKMVERDRDRFEKAYEEERTSRKKIKEEKEKVDKDFAAYKQQTELDKIANAKPTGLAGFGENPMVNKLIDGIAPHIGPSVGKWLERLMEPGAGGQQLAGGGEQPLQFAQWLQTKTPETQNFVMQTLGALMQIPDESTLIQKIGQIQQMVLGEYLRATA